MTDRAAAHESRASVPQQPNGELTGLTGWEEEIDRIVIHVGDIALQFGAAFNLNLLVQTSFRLPQDASTLTQHPADPIL